MKNIQGYLYVVTTTPKEEEEKQKGVSWLTSRPGHQWQARELSQHTLYELDIPARNP